MTNFWLNLPKPFWVLAPMEDVTDTVFRQIVASVGKPHVFFTEFTNAEGILSQGSNEVTKRLRFSQSEHPIVAQIWGTDSVKFQQSAELIKKLGFDGIDINFGCPEKRIVKQGACSAMIGQNSKAAEIISAVKSVGLPVSVKTRIGNKHIMTEDWIGFLLSQNLEAITIHARTAAEMSNVPAHWDEIEKAVILRDKSKSKTLIIGNGDVADLPSAKSLVLSAKVDGVMIGRGIFANPAVFSNKQLSLPQKQKLFVKHIQLFEKTWEKEKNFQILKKFVKTYISGFDGASRARDRCMQANNYQELVRFVLEI
jgi:tRNA-dihydrouridine synthase